MLDLDFGLKLWNGQILNFLDAKFDENIPSLWINENFGATNYTDRWPGEHWSESYYLFIFKRLIPSLDASDLGNFFKYL
ncbi:unnamed protein product [Rhizophagus irregularis]|uniref:Uncharacterized protein n=1 Tax=Rhizophagus irregularis TaxID=588596 RepID=A0A915YQH2_9GLOM|nr:unnamed protein product [Rhizophagus irregularis]